MHVCHFTAYVTVLLSLQHHKWIEYLHGIKILKMVCMNFCLKHHRIMTYVMVPLWYHGLPHPGYENLFAKRDSGHEQSYNDQTLESMNVCKNVMAIHQISFGRPTLAILRAMRLAWLKIHICFLPKSNRGGLQWIFEYLKKKNTLKNHKIGKKAGNKPLIWQCEITLSKYSLQVETVFVMLQYYHSVLLTLSTYLTVCPSFILGSITPIFRAVHTRIRSPRMHFN